MILTTTCAEDKKEEKKKKTIKLKQLQILNVNLIQQILIILILNM